MNKQEAIEKIKELRSYTLEEGPFEFDVIKKGPVINLISQIDQPQKVMVPKFVAEWIEYCKTNELTLLGAFDPVSEHGIGLANTFTGQVWKCVDWAKRNQETFARAWLDGYEIEQEQLYTVEIPNPHRKGKKRVMLMRNIDGLIILEKRKESVGKNNQLTESEIKKDFEWAWQ